jgi:UDP-glucose 4-epimerase
MPVKEGPCRAGTPPWLVAAARKIREVPGWRPKHDNLDEIVRSAYAREQRLNAAN